MSLEAKNAAFWDAQPLGEMSDCELSRRIGFSAATIGKQRRWRGIKPFSCFGWQKKTRLEKVKKKRLKMSSTKKRIKKMSTPYDMKITRLKGFKFLRMMRQSNGGAIDLDNPQNQAAIYRLIYDSVGTTMTLESDGIFSMRIRKTREQIATGSCIGELLFNALKATSERHD